MPGGSRDCDPAQVGLIERFAMPGDLQRKARFRLELIAFRAPIGRNHASGFEMRHFTPGGQE